MPRKLPVRSKSAALPAAAGRDLPAAAGRGLPAAFDEAPRRPQLQRMVAAITRYKWLVLLLVCAGLAGGVLASRLIKPKYLAEATIWIQATDRRESGRGPIQSSELLQSYAWIDLLRSFAVLDAVVREERLYLEHAPRDRVTLASFRLGQMFRPGKYRLKIDKAGRNFELTTDAGLFIQRGAVGNSIGTAVGFNWAPAAAALGRDRNIDFEVTTPRDAARRLNQQLQTRMAPEGNFLRIEFKKTDDPERVAAVLNAVIDRYIEVAAQLKRAKLNEVAAILEEQRQYAERNLRHAEIALEGFRVQTVTLPSDEVTAVVPGLQITQNPVFSNYFSLQFEREQLRRDAEGIHKALYTSGDSALTIDGLVAVGSVQRSPELTKALADLTVKRAELRALRQQYTPEHPVVMRLVADITTHEQKTIPQLAAGLLDQLQSRTAVLERWIASAAGDLRNIPPRMIEEARLRRQVEIAERLHTNLRERHEEARLASATSIADVRILDRATAPQRPITNVTVQIILMGFAAGIALGLLLAILLDRFDRRVRYPEQVTDDMRLTILGALPDVKTRRAVNGAGTAHAVEALREIRLNLAHAAPRDAALVVTVSSPGSGDGKTFITCKLALAFTAAGQRTIIVDGDTRRGELHRLVALSRKPGLTDYLIGKVTAREIVQRTSYERLDFIASGTRVQGAPNLLGSPAMQELLESLRKSYEVVLVDSPPLAAGVDPFILGTLTANLMLVIRSGRTDRALTGAKLEMLDRLPIRVLGAVVNGVESDRVYRYYSYLPGYEAPADEAVGSAGELERV